MGQSQPRFPRALRARASTLVLAAQEVSMVQAPTRRLVFSPTYRACLLALMAASLAAAAVAQPAWIGPQAGKPSPRRDHAAVWDQQRGELVVFGGGYGGAFPSPV